jgi:hypothetical protein
MNLLRQNSLYHTLLKFDSFSLAIVAIAITKQSNFCINL